METFNNIMKPSLDFLLSFFALINCLCIGRKKSKGWVFKKQVLTLLEVCWCMPVIPPLRRLRQENGEFQAQLAT
jgi:hypothetical protein